MVDAAQQRKGRRTIGLMAAVFLTPMLIAGWLYNSERDWVTQSTRNQGDLVQPARPLQEFTLQALDGSSVNLETLRHHWTLVYIGATSCDQACADVLYKTRQSRLAQGKELKRIQRLFVLDGVKLSAAERATLAQSHPDLLIAEGSAQQLQALVSQFAIDATPVAQAGRVYLLDPLGNLMMSYRPGFEAKSLIKDLTRLLSTSQIG